MLLQELLVPVADILTNSIDSAPLHAGCMVGHTEVVVATSAPHPLSSMFSICDPNSDPNLQLLIFGRSPPRWRSPSNVDVVMSVCLYSPETLKRLLAVNCRQTALATGRALHPFFAAPAAP